MVASVLSVGDPLGYTADEIVEELHLPVDGTALQQDLEEMVAAGVLDRRGVGRGALYTLLRPVRLTKADKTGASAGLTTHEPFTSKAG